MNESDLQTALATRINLQIVISQIPAIEEHMDLPLTRWLDSVPLPPEMPRGAAISLSVWLGSDLSRMGWSAHGDPAGFIPKMADYLQKCGMTPGDLDLINRMGESMEPNQVGSWIAAVNGAIRSGWQFCEPMALERIAPYLGDDLVVTKLMSWTAKRDVVEYRRFVRSVSKAPTSTLELSLPPETVADKLAMAGEGFADLGGAALDPALLPGLEDATDITLGVQLGAGQVQSMSVFARGLRPDVVSALCAAGGITYDDAVGQIARMLKADDIERIVYRRSADGTATVDLELVPNQLDKAAGPGAN